MYCAISVSRTARAAVYAGLPLPPGTSLVLGTPPNSLYCTQKSVSRISAAAANLSIAASPRVRRPLFSSGRGPSCIRAAVSRAISVRPRVPALAVTIPFFRNVRRLEPLVSTLSVFMAFSSRDSNQTCRFEFWHRSPRITWVISRGGTVHLALRQSAFWRKKNDQWPITDPSSSTGRRRTEDSVETVSGNRCLGLLLYPWIKSRKNQ